MRRRKSFGRRPTRSEPATRGCEIGAAYPQSPIARLHVQGPARTASGIDLECGSNPPMGGSRAPRIWGRRENALGYVIAAYGIVIGSLAVYALWIRIERRKLMTRGEQDSSDSRRT